MKAWQVLYCGGNDAISVALAKVAREFGIAYKQEKFEW